MPVSITAQVIRSQSTSKSCSAASALIVERDMNTAGTTGRFAPTDATVVLPNLVA